MLLYPRLSASQSLPNPADTSYVMSLLHQAEAIEMQQPQTALRHYQQALSLARQMGYTKGYFASLRLITYVLDLLGRHDQSYQLATQGLQKAMQDTNQQYRSWCHFALAQSAKWQGKNKEAIRHFTLAAPFILARKNPQKLAALYQNLGLVYETEELYPQALAYFNRALTYDRLANSSKLELAIDYQSIAVVLVKQNRLRLGLAYFHQQRALLDPLRDLQPLTQLYGNLANLHKELGHSDSSLYYYQNALRLNRQLHNPHQQLHLLAGLAETHNHLKHYPRAKALLDQAHAMATQQRAGLSEWRNIYREYANANRGLGHYKNALGWYDHYLQTQDSLASQEAKALLADYDLKLRQAEAGKKLAQTQQQISRLEQARQTQNLWTLVAALAGLVLLSGLVFAFLYARQRQRTADHALRAAEGEHALAVVESELLGQRNERLRIAKEMHDDLGASLTAIGLLSEVVKSRMGLSTTPEVEKISSISAEMVSSMNEIIWSLNTKNDSLNGLIAYTRAYVSEFIEHTALSLKTAVTESVDDLPMRGEDRRNVFLTVKEALHNVVKHAQATQVTLLIQPRQGQLVIEVGDNGHGFSPNEQTRLRNGLGNMQQRMQESGGSCQVVSLPAGTWVTITFPYPAATTPKILQT